VPPNANPAVWILIRVIMLVKKNSLDAIDAAREDVTLTQQVRLHPRNRERKCADTIGTVLVPWPFPMLKYKYIFQIKYTEAILSNSTRKLPKLRLPKC